MAGIIVILCVVMLVSGTPVEIDPTARIYTIEIVNRTPGAPCCWQHIKDPQFHQSGGATFKDTSGKEVIFGPSVQWVATQE